MGIIQFAMLVYQRVETCNKHGCFRKQMEINECFLVHGQSTILEVLMGYVWVLLGAGQCANLVEI